MSSRTFARYALVLLGAVTLSVAGAGEAPRAPGLFEEALEISRELDPDTDLAACRKAYGKLLASARGQLQAARSKAEGGKLTARATIAILSRVILADRNVSYISNQHWRDSIFTSALIKGRGNCLSTALLYHLVAGDLKLPVRMTFAPEHALVRWDDGKETHLIETTRRGIVLPHERAMKYFSLKKEDLRPNLFLCRLSDKEVRGVLLAGWAANLYGMGKRKRAHVLIKAASAARPDCGRILLVRAGFAETEGQSDSAHALLKRYAASAKGPWALAQASQAYADLLANRGKFDAAIGVLKDRYKSAPHLQKVRMVRLLGVMYRHKRNWKESIRLHKLYVLLKPGQNSYNELGSVLTEAHHDKEAIAAYEKVLTYNPEDYFPKVILAGLYERSGNRKKGRALFARIQEPRGSKLGWYCSLVWYYANVSEGQKLLENMRAAFALDRSGHVYHYFLREPDLDPYRKKKDFAALMRKNTPKPKDETKIDLPGAGEKKSPPTPKTPKKVPAQL
jgi:tetratricopeptide (TPR) repeat protein